MPRRRWIIMSKNVYNIRVISEMNEQVAFTLSVNSAPCNLQEGSFITMQKENFQQFVSDLKATVTQKPRRY
jgi:hypothetical protein